MTSFRRTALAAVAMFLTSARADYYIEPDSVDYSLRLYWCQSQQSQCPLICGEVDSRPTLVNTCDPDSLSYGCICGNGQQPDLDKYSLTIPYFTCTEFGTQCVAACGSTDSACASACREENPCGAQNVEVQSTTTATGTTATTATTATTTESEDAEETDEIFDGLAGATETPGAATVMVPLEVTRGYGLVVVLGGLMAGFAML